MLEDEELLLGVDEEDDEELLDDDEELLLLDEEDEEELLPVDEELLLDEEELELLLEELELLPICEELLLEEEELLLLEEELLLDEEDEELDSSGICVGRGMIFSTIIESAKLNTNPKGPGVGARGRLFATHCPGIKDRLWRALANGRGRARARVLEAAFPKS